jgi:hypothetical protein
VENSGQITAKRQQHARIRRQLKLTTACENQTTIIPDNSMREFAKVEGENAKAEKIVLMEMAVTFLHFNDFLCGCNEPKMIWMQLLAANTIFCCF